jgi:hypothetical protein
VDNSSGSELNVKISSGSSKHSVSFAEAENVSDKSSMQPHVWTNLGAEQPHFHLLARPQSCFVHHTLQK